MILVGQVCPHCRAYRERAEEAEEAVRQLRGAFGGEPAEPLELPRAWRLTAAERQICRLLLSRTQLTLAGYMALRELEAGAAGAPQDKVFNVLISKLRKKLRPFGVEIETVWGEGYRIDPAQRRAILALEHPAASIGMPIAPPPARPSATISDLIVRALRRGGVLGRRAIWEQVNRARGRPAAFGSICATIWKLLEAGVVESLPAPTAGRWSDGAERKVYRLAERRDA
ncbi:MAG TPA: winged helix-turn-helix domain-containing protein [Caulobacteraceae bacterium]|jgi:two-component system cell cycle response regulator CtrA|nr:winged helix-turn-helix domain-containing protein [Caulobacteraceae bacterium]